MLARRPIILSPVYHTDDPWADVHTAASSVFEEVDAYNRETLDFFKDYIRLFKVPLGPQP